MNFESIHFIKGGSLIQPNPELPHLWLQAEVEISCRNLAFVVGEVLGLLCFDLEFKQHPKSQAQLTPQDVWLYFCCVLSLLLVRAFLMCHLNQLRAHGNTRALCRQALFCRYRKGGSARFAQSHRANTLRTRVASLLLSLDHIVKPILWPASFSGFKRKRNFHCTKSFDNTRRCLGIMWLLKIVVWHRKIYQGVFILFSRISLSRHD